MADEGAHDGADRIAALLRENPGRVEPEDAADAGIGLLQALGPDASVEELRLAAELVGFAVDTASGHPSIPHWQRVLGCAHGWIAEETGSAADYETAASCLLAAASAPGSPPEVAESAAVEASEMVATLLRTEAVTAERARQLTGALDRISLSWTDSLNAAYFALGRAWALRWAHPLTGDHNDLERAADLLRGALTAPALAEAGHDCVDGWQLFVDVLEQLYLAGADRSLLTEALAAAKKLLELLAADPERLPDAHGIVAEVANEIFCTSDGEATAELETAITSYAAKRASAGLNDHETVCCALLLQVRGCTSEDAPVLSSAAEVLGTPERAPGSEVVLAGLHESLLELSGHEHAWPAVEWATRALTHADVDPGVVVPLHSSRISGLAAALDAFGGDAVADRCDVDAMLAEARAEALAGPDAARALLAYRTAQLRGQWIADRFPLDVSLMQEVFAETADALRRMSEHDEEGRSPELGAAAAVLEDMIPVLLGYRDPGPLRAALHDEGVRSLLDADSLLKMLDQRTALQAMVDGKQPLGPGIQQMVADLAATEAARPGEESAALLPLLTALGEAAGSVENGDLAARTAAYRKVLRMCGELPEKAAASPFVRRIRGFVSAQMVLGGHDGDEAEPAIEDLERALERPDSGQPAVDEQLCRLLRRRGGPGDFARSRQVALRALARQTWQIFLFPQWEPSTPVHRFARTAAGWCHADDALDDLVRVVEAERGAALARGAGAELLRDRLGQTGRAELAEAWPSAQSADEAARRRVAAQLSEEDERTLAEPPGPDEIRRSLRDRGLDALVYLIPHDPAAGGTAVVVPAEGPVASSRLPLLAAEPFTRDPSREPAALDALGGWAWLAGGAAVLAAAQAAAPGRVPRIALVPAGALGAAPWAAAWRETGSGRRYLVEDVEITLVPSAGLLTRRSAMDSAGLADGELVLQACTADHATRSSYDEALEPSSAFLAAGARVVVRGAWPHSPAPVLFSLFQQYLDEDPARPAAAFRRAQLSMLAPDNGSAHISRWGGFALLGA
ncbi:CHAT domain-containing protein [Amycolatopsis sp. FU40]|uniref:CHAT domain-containing protein n=1 Tax=Amycolatopsis sp. FU40 TaxID=2914159 RepID=UPI001F18E2F1|nr:CHAT domain-containing protein [Amycolatopsis sp. FU40]UKD57161.1 CHAT domain-containing protein [Amycolatopsis sp. FU40]